uniref:DUF5869 protein n=1 Tax=Clandestinovirus TaxID=2831644 RepID=A0A8F8KL41_9VIRU|nr:DUF5869 protein [Clandestinovirus]
MQLPSEIVRLVGCKNYADKFSVEFQSRFEFPREVKQALVCSHHGDGPQIERTTLSYRLDHGQSSEVWNPEKWPLTKLLRPEAEHFGDIDDSLISIYSITLFPRAHDYMVGDDPDDEFCIFTSEPTFTGFTTTQVPGTLFIIDDHSIKSDCDCCDGATSSSVTLCPISNNTQLFSYLRSKRGANNIYVADETEFQDVLLNK